MQPQTLPETLTRQAAQELVNAGLYTYQNGRWDGAEVGYMIPTRPNLPTYMLRTLDWRITIH